MEKNFSNIPKIRVIIRKRPLSKKQVSRGEKDIIQMPNTRTVLVKQQKVKVDLTPYLDQYKFIFDGAFNQQTTNQQIYTSTIRPLIDAAFDGARVSCFAYGQTGSGKTYTMLGDGRNVRGLYLLAARDVFDIKRSFNDLSLWVSFYEIYCGKLYDLLNDRSILHARQDAKSNINIVGLSERKVDSMEEVMKSIQYGMSIRVTAQNSTNVDSSRSHAILQLTLRKNKKVYGKVSFIDLAGSQRAADHADQTDKQTRIDGAQINKSLLALKQCIRALDQGKQHTPFRGSKLTMVLKDSFVGYCKTVMIANVSPNQSSCENTLNTLKYADRVKQLKKAVDADKLPQSELNMLSKQLMLPRQLIGRQRIEIKQQLKHVQSGSYVVHNNYFQQHVNQSTKIRNVSQAIHPSGQKDKKYSHHGDYSLQNQKQRSSSGNSLNLNHFSFHSQQQIQDNLRLRHQQMVQKVIQGEQTLMSEHQKFVNFSVQTAKQHIQMMHQADQPGNSIQTYLNKLQSTLQTQIEQIYRMKAMIENLKYNLDESKKIENLYMNVKENGFHYVKNERQKPTFYHPKLENLNFSYHQFEKQNIKKDEHNNGGDQMLI